jgi:RNA-binding protein
MLGAITEITRPAAGISPNRSLSCFLGLNEGLSWTGHDKSLRHRPAPVLAIQFAPRAGGISTGLAPNLIHHTLIHPHFDLSPHSEDRIMPLEQSRKKQMRTIGHHLNPIVTVSEKGLSEGIHSELERALEDHELIKMKLALGDPASRRELAAELCTQHNAELVQQIGKVILIYRKAQKPNPKLSNLLRPI